MGGQGCGPELESRLCWSEALGLTSLPRLKISANGYVAMWGIGSVPAVFCIWPQKAPRVLHLLSTKWRSESTLEGLEIQGSLGHGEGCLGPSREWWGGAKTREGSSS